MPYDVNKPIRIHDRPPPPSWQRRSRWFPHMDPGDALVLSSIIFFIIAGLIAVLLVAAGTVFQTFDPLVLNARVIETADGYALVDNRTPANEWPAGAEVARLVWSSRHEARGYFGPFTVRQWRHPNVVLILERDRHISSEEAMMLAASARDTLQHYTFDPPLDVAELYDGDWRFRFKPAETRLVWSGIPLNLVFLVLLACGLWASSWMTFSIRNYRDPRRKRGIKLAAYLCPRCNYDIRLIGSHRCPECGEALVIDPNPAD